MGLAVDSIKDTFTFLRTYPKSFIFTILMIIPISVGSFLMSLGPLSFILAAIVPFQIPSVPLSILSIPIMLTFIVVGLVIMIIGDLILVGGFPLLVTQAIEEKKVEILRTIRESFQRIRDLFIANLILGILLIAISLAIGFLMSLGWATLILTILAVIGGIIVPIYLGLRLALFYPVLMIERKGAIESLKTSWRITKGKILSLLAVVVLFLLIVQLPLFLIGVGIGVLAASAQAIWNIISGIIAGTFSGLLFVIYYYYLKEAEKGKL